MNVGMYGILIIFGLFIVLLVVNPKLSCFGRRIKSPFYPLLRKRKRGLKGRETGPQDGDPKAATKKKAEDYGFRLD